jgi:hypothetical protein
MNVDWHVFPRQNTSAAEFSLVSGLPVQHKLFLLNLYAFFPLGKIALPHCNILPATGPLSVLTIAGNVIRFVDFGSCLLGELYRSSTGSLAVHDELELAPSDLRTVVVTLRQFVPESDQSSDDTWRNFA